MLILLVPSITAVYALERAGHARARSRGRPFGRERRLRRKPGGKEVRFGPGADGDLGRSDDGRVEWKRERDARLAHTQLGGLVPMVLMQLGEVVFGGAGSGLYGMLAFAIVAVFVAGLMVGRTPEYLGKKIGAYEMKMAALAILAPCIAVLVGTAVACVTDAGRAGALNPGVHGFSEILYAFSSAANNNGSAFAGLTANTPFYDTALGLAMLAARYVPIVVVLGLAGALAEKKIVPAGAGTLPTHGPLFVVLLLGTVLLVGALTFLPALALGPIVEHLQMVAGAG
jgi:K+-transporting ATPase ATPase A chain